MSIEFWLDRKDMQDGGGLEYRPWGTRTLKIQVKTAVDLPAMRLRLKNVGTGSGLVRAYADDSKELVVSWGGGHQKNPPVRAKDWLVAFEKPAPLKAGETNYVYFNITHAGPGPGLPDNAALTLEAYPKDGGEAQATLTINLQKPAGYPQDAIRMVPVAGEKGSWVVGPGEYLPVYDGRWWPAPKVRYTPASVPALTVQRDGNRLQVHWPGKEEPIAVITDQTQPLILDQADGSVALELFQFIDPAQKYIALRIWFFWLDTDITYHSLGGLGRHEVPDSERFDLLIRRQDGQVMLACTDLHWQEMWGQVTRYTMQATIGLNMKQKMKLGKEKVWKWISREKDGRRNYNPIGYIERLAQRLAADDETQRALTVRAKGTEAHVPTLNDVQQITLDEGGNVIKVTKGTTTMHDMTSSDVRLV